MILKAVVFAAILAVAFSGYTFPDDFKSCSANSDSTCMVDLLQDAFYKLGTKGISSPIKFNINPMILASWSFSVDTSSVKSHEHFWDLRHPTLWNSTVLAASFNSSSYTISFTTYTERLAEYCSHYQIWAELYTDSSTEIVFGNGTVNRNIYGLTMEHTIALSLVNINGTEYFFVGSYDVTFKNYTNVIFDYQDLRYGNESYAALIPSAINAAASNMVQDNPEVIINALVSMLEVYAQTLVSSVPARTILEHLAA